MTVIAVAGTASRSLPPERGVVRLRVVGEGATREEAVDPVRPVLARVTADAGAFEGAGEATRWSATSIATSIELRYEGADTPRRVHVASAPVEVRFRDLEALRRWVGLLVDEALIQVDGVDWILTEPTRSAVERELRGAAVQDAAERARDYATALGDPEVRAVRLWESGLRPRERDGVFAAAEARFARGGGDGVDLHPAPVVVAIHLTVDFESGPRDAATAAG